MSAVSPVGTIAYVIEEEALLVRVNSGWQYIAVSIISVTASDSRVKNPHHYRKGDATIMGGYVANAGSNAASATIWSQRLLGGLGRKRVLRCRCDCVVGKCRGG